MAAGAYIFAPAGETLAPDERSFFREADPWGFILFARNVVCPEQLTALTSDLRESVGRDAPVFIDQEGGRVQRMRAPHWREWAPPLDDALKGGAEALAARYRIIAAELRAVGIDGNCAPCADIARDETHPFLKNRCYGTDARSVALAAQAVAAALLEGGVLPVMKHMPGHGRAVADSHKALPVVEADRETLMAEDFAPFAALSCLPLGMTSHIIYSEIDPSAPATQSPDVIGLIRDTLGFDGLLMTDDISMEALTGPVEARGAAALAAGCDAVLHCNGDLGEMQAIAAAAGRLTSEGARRGDAALAARRAPGAIDIDAELAKLGHLLAERSHA